MKFVHAGIQGFRSFTEAQEIDFTTLRPGLYHVTGQNLVEPELEANGAGKSSLFEALCWGLYGKTSQGLRAGTVKHWTSKDQCAVALQLDTATGPLSILRTWQPNTLEIDDGKGTRPVNQEELDQLVGMPQDAFLFAVHFAQFAPAFVDLDAARQTAVFSSVLGLGLWEAAAAESAEKGREIAQEAQSLRERSARLAGQAEELLRTDYSTQTAAWDREQKAAIIALQKEIASHEKQAGSLQKELKVAQTTLEKAQTEGSDRAGVGVKIGEVKYRIETTERALDKLDNLKSGPCPTCGQPLSKAHFAAERDRLNKELKSATNEANTLSKNLTMLQDAATAVRQAQNECSQISSKLSTLIGRTHGLGRELVAADARSNPFRQLEHEAEIKGQSLVEEIERVEAELSTKGHQTADTQYWVKGFKEIRLSLIQDSLAQLTLETNEALFQLGLQDWSIEFDIERETKSGTISKSFSVMIHAPQAKTAVPWGTWSGGESQRLRVAISMGFANLICSRAGLHPNLEMWDEPSTWLSETGIQDLLQVLVDRAERLQKIILLADHRALDFGGFAGTICITKTSTGSIINTGG